MGKLKEHIRENGGFQHWFVNVFWYHYKWPLLVCVVILGVVAFITIDALRKERYDTTVVIATDYYVDDTQLEPLDELLKSVVEDLDGNGKVNIRYVILFVGDTEVGRQNQERMYLYASQEDVALYLMSGDISAAYTDPVLDFFTDELSQYGLPYDESNPVRLSLAGNPVLEQCGMRDIYLSIMDFTTVSGTSEARNARDMAVSMAKALSDAGETEE